MCTINQIPNNNVYTCMRVLRILLSKVMEKIIFGGLAMEFLFIIFFSCVREAIIEAEEREIPVERNLVG